MNKLTLSALLASFLLISACDQTADDTTGTDKAVMDNAKEMSEDAAAAVTKSTSDAIDATKEMAKDVAESTSEAVNNAADASAAMANDIADSAIEMKDDMTNDTTPKDKY